MYIGAAFFMPSHMNAKRPGIDEIRPTDILYVDDITNITNEI